MESTITMTTEDDSLAHHLEHLRADAADVQALLTASHRDGGDVHPEALAKSARLQTSLADVIYALTHHEHLAMDADDAWKLLTIEHKAREINPSAGS